MARDRLTATVVALRELIMAGEHYRMVAAKELGLTVTESQAVSYLMARGPMGQNELAHALQLAPGSTTSLVDRLEARDVVRRVAHATDRRRSIVHLNTEKLPILEELGSWLFDVCAALPPTAQRDTANRLHELAGYINDRVTNGPAERVAS